MIARLRLLLWRKRLTLLIPYRPVVVQAQDDLVFALGLEQRFVEHGRVADTNAALAGDVRHPPPPR